MAGGLRVGSRVESRFCELGVGDLGWVGDGDGIGVGFAEMVLAAMEYSLSFCFFWRVR